ncbi:unnamed protein product [Adineta steineri]|uniref:Uncharacterized protein n=1 Tax=Adineta steineri TaxID=433720 RepID=A0A813VHA4_9BILA|nr:unnamed protein product [Adineta steineri]
MSSVGYCFNICRTIDKNLTQQRRSSVSQPITSNISTNPGALIFGRRFSLSDMMILPHLGLSSQQENSSSIDQIQE